MQTTKIDKSKLVYTFNPDLDTIDWAYICNLFYKVNWRTRIEDEIKLAFSKSSVTVFIYLEDKIIAFGRTIDDGRYYAQLGDIIVDPEFQGNGLGKSLVTKINEKLENYHFVTLTAAPGKSDFYKSLGWKKQSTAFIWPQGPKELRQHTNHETD